jgi:NADH-quinone oxidoreductase subunit N
MDALIIVFAGALISLFIAFTKKPWMVVSAAIGSLLAAIVVMIYQLKTGFAYFTFENYQGISFDPGALMYSIAICVLAVLVIGIGHERFKETPFHTGEYISLLMFSTVGAMLLTSFTDLFIFFLGLEIMSIPIYVMAGSNKKDVRSTEAALKYFLTGSFATGILLFGIAWIYASTGTFRINEIAMSIATMESYSPSLMIGILLIMASFVFKISAAPFHFWSPDVYDGSPYAVTGFMATIIKLAAFFAFFKIFAICFAFPELFTFWTQALAVITVITLFVGNLPALRQTTLKRLIAYSSITHAGYALLTILSGSEVSIIALWFYLLSYGFSVVSLIAVGMLINDVEDKIDGLKGLIQRSPLLAVVGTIAVLSMAGIPPTAGFFAKYLVFVNAWHQYSWLVIIALLNSAISIYYYLKVVIAMLSKSDNPSESKVQMSPLTITILVVSTIGTLGLSFVLPFILQ